MLYNKIETYLNISSQFSKLLQLVSTEKKLRLSGLNNSAKALALSHVFNNSNKSILLVTENDSIAQHACDDLEVLLSKEKIFHLSGYELLPYERFSPRKTVQLERSNTLSAAISGKSGIYVVSLRELLRIISTPKIYKKLLLTLEKDKEYNIDLILSHLVSAGYHNTSQIAQAGEISKRGGILDIFSPQYKHPIRLEFWGDEITSIREFDLSSQLSLREDLIEIIAQPIRELSLEHLKANIPERLQNRIAEHGFYEGIEHDMSLLLEKTSSFLSYFSIKDCILALYDEEKLAGAQAHLFDEVQENYEKKISHVKHGLVPEPHTLFKKQTDLEMENFQTLHFTQADISAVRSYIEFSCKTQMNYNSKLELLTADIEQLIKNKFSVIIQSDNISQSNRMQTMLTDFAENVHFHVGVFQKGFILEDAKLAIFTDHEIFNRYRQKRRFAHFKKAEALSDYEILKPGDYIVHIDYGIGIFQGIENISVQERNMDCLLLQYADNDKIYVPTDQLQQVAKFVTQEGIIPELHKLDSTRWETTKKKLKKDVEQIAADLLYLYAQRKIAVGYAFAEDTEWQKDVESSFIYEDTIDQIKATEEVKADMETAIPMERLICGDVGFGKTEVAIRVAFKAVMDSKQVAFLVPTTILAEQHYVTFSERLKDYPIRIEMLSRFVTPTKQKVIIDRIKYGESDIIIGTHRLLSKDVQFKELGLIIIDEEQRFGVRHKERLKALKHNVDVLMLSATPIPRTLDMALTGVKDMTIMNVPPENRLPVRTAVIEYNEDLIISAIRREIDRQGQVFFLHNRVETIYGMEEKLSALMKDVSFRVAHAQMSARELEQVMMDFYHHQFDVLVCTTIIESGIDIPNVNTIIINRADKFGLAQLYQLRGRVGRSDHQAYAYLIVPKKITKTSNERLRTIEQHEALGSGLHIAMRDLEIRGAGNILGKKQHGIMNTIGMNFYNQLLKRAIDKIKQGEDRDIFDTERYHTKIQCEIPFSLPDNFIEDDAIRLDFYKRLNNAEDDTKFQSLQKEMRDRFGPLPQVTQYVFQYYHVSYWLAKSSISSLFIGKRKITVEVDSTVLTKNRIEDIIKHIPHDVQFSMTKGAKITIKLSHNKIDSFKTNFDVCIQIIKILSKKKPDRT
ncbi:MAG: transcription-repair coupling factor [Candidatus Celaenobacter antarcticus]|nr:transcription-repair coupling factor [Candidatus Celaenobacter antarcticus]